MPLRTPTSGNLQSGQRKPEYLASSGNGKWEAERREAAGRAAENTKQVESCRVSSSDHKHMASFGIVRRRRENNKLRPVQLRTPTSSKLQGGQQRRGLGFRVTLNPKPQCAS